MNPTIIKPEDLLPGDVLLYHGNSLLARLIRLFDGTEYNHAAIWTGNNVVEALGNGVNQRPLAVSLADSEYVHAYRYRDGSGCFLGAPTVPAKPVVDKANQFAADKDRYGYEQILLLAMLGSTRRLTTTVPFLGQILRNFLDEASDVLANLARGQKEPLICSELVFRCYDESGDAYKILIRGADILATAAAGTMSTAGYLGQPGDDGGFAEAASTFLANYAAVKGAAATKAGLGGSVMAVANFVTPGDLSKSPNLQKLGRVTA